jgi:acyl carrier protein
MTKAEFLKHLDEMLALSPGTLTGAEVLKDLDGWDSLAVMFFIGMADEKLGTAVNAEKVAKSKTINDLIALCGDAVKP